MIRAYDRGIERLAWAAFFATQFSPDELIAMIDDAIAYAAARGDETECLLAWRKVLASDSKARSRKTDPSEKGWPKLRYETLRRHGFRCQACGATAESGTELHVDHIKPFARFPELARDPNNLQVLCSTCNLGKGVSHD